MKIYKLLLLSLCFMSSLYGQSTSEEDQKEEKYDEFVFTFTPERGDFVFVGIDDDDSGRLISDIGVAPFGTYFFSTEMKKKRGVFELTIRKKKELKNLDSDYNFKLLASIGKEKVLKSNFITRRASRKWERKIEHVKIRKIEHKVKIKGVKYYRIPYLKTEKKIDYLIIVITKKLSNFKKLIHIPNSYVFYDWDGYYIIKR